MRMVAFAMSAFVLAVATLGACRQDPFAASGGGHQQTSLVGATCGDGKCETGRKEDCAGCPEDCGRCTGCQTTMAPACFGCKCERCVCAKLPSCCGAQGRWEKQCVAACKEQCGGCGAGTHQVPAQQPRTPAPDTSAHWTCGDGKCEVDQGEDCGLCQKDCGLCDGCQIRFVAGCQQCGCQQCVCAKIPSCCSKKGRWDQKCVAACKDLCGGCKKAN